MTTIVPSFSPKDFGKAASDYAIYRKGFPQSFFDRLLRDGVGKASQRILDLGTGTGTLARGFAKQGAVATGLDITPELIEQARKLGEKDGVHVDYVLGKAEEVPLPSESFDVITAGHCWHWFDGDAAAKECMRLLKPGGLLVITHFSYLPVNGNVAEATEELILKYNPQWPLAGMDGRYEKWQIPMESAGLSDIRSFFYDEDVPHTHEEWRGRIRACNGVLALNEDAKIKRFDHDLDSMLNNRFAAEPLLIPHRVFVIQGQKQRLIG